MSNFKNDSNLDVHIDDWTLEQYILKELPSDRLNEIEARIKTDSTLKIRLRELEQSNEAILKQYSPGEMASTIRDRLRVENAKIDMEQRRRKVRGFPKWMVALPSLTAAVLIFVFLLPVFNGQDGIRLKGENKDLLMIYRQNDNLEKELLEPNDIAYAGDLLQVVYKSPGVSYGVILSIDGRGVVTLHFPATRTGSTLLKKGGKGDKVSLDSAYELDDAPDFERFFLIVSNTPLDTASVMAKAERLAADIPRCKIGSIDLDKKVDNEIRQYSILIRKGERK